MRSTSSQVWIEETYAQFGEMVYNLALHYSQSEEDAEEITQDVFLKVYNKYKSFKAEAQLKTWVYRITVNTSLDFLKARQAVKRQIWRNTLRFGGTFEEGRAFQNTSPPGFQLEQKEALENIFQCINQLPERQKTALLLLKVEGLKSKEVCEIMDVQEKALESLYQRAKKKLKELLDKE